MSIVVMVDSGASLSKKMLKQYGLVLLPYNIIFKNGDIYKDLIEVKDNKTLMELMESHNEYPCINQIGNDEVETYLKKYLDLGNDILYIGVSTHLSNACNEVAKVAKKFDSNAIEIIDSLNVGVGETLLAILAKELIDKGYGLKRAAKYLNEIKYNIKSNYFIADSLYFYKGNKCKDINDRYLEYRNRIPVAEISEGKIVLTFNAKEDVLALQVIKNKLDDFSKKINPYHLLISYSIDKTKAIKLRNFANKLMPNVKIEIVENNSVVFTNSGKDSVSVAFLLEK